jgi:hypothetical protein
LLFDPPSNLSPLVIEISHPLISAAGVKGVAIESFQPPVRAPNGIWTARIDCLEFRPPAPALVKPRGSIPSPEKGPVITAKTEADRALDQARIDFRDERNAAAESQRRLLGGS